MNTTKETTIGVNLRVTAHSNQGGRKYMEDMFCVAYQPTSDEKDLLYAYFGIFDGHGGRDAAIYAKTHLMDHIVSQKNFWSEEDDLVLKAIRDGFISVHHAMWRVVEKWPKTHSGLPSTSGTTASVGFVRRGKLYIGHVGDSGIVLGYKDPNSQYWKAKPLTVDHKPESPIEQARIVKCGGKVINKSGVPRVVWNRPCSGHKGPVRRSTQLEEIPFLAVARSLGDLWSYNSEQNDFVVSPVPDTTVMSIDVNSHRCLILGSDGLWNMLSAQDAVNSVYFAEKNNERQVQIAAAQGEINSPKNWINPSKRLVDRAIDRWTTNQLRPDNTSVVTVVIDPPGPPKGPKDARRDSNSSISTMIPNTPCAQMTGHHVLEPTPDDPGSSPKYPEDSVPALPSPGPSGTSVEGIRAGPSLQQTRTSPTFKINSPTRIQQLAAARPKLRFTVTRPVAGTSAAARNEVVSEVEPIRQLPQPRFVTSEIPALAHGPPDDVVDEQLRKIRANVLNHLRQQQHRIIGEEPIRPQQQQRAAVAGPSRQQPQRAVVPGPTRQQQQRGVVASPTRQQQQRTVVASPTRAVVASPTRQQQQRVGVAGPTRQQQQQPAAVEGPTRQLASPDGATSPQRPIPAADDEAPPGPSSGSDGPARTQQSSPSANPAPPQQRPNAVSVGQARPQRPSVVVGAQARQQRAIVLRYGQTPRVNQTRPIAARYGQTPRQRPIHVVDHRLAFARQVINVSDGRSPHQQNPNDGQARQQRPNAAIAGQAQQQRVNAIEGLRRQPRAVVNGQARQVANGVIAGQPRLRRVNAVIDAQRRQQRANAVLEGQRRAQQQRANAAAEVQRRTQQQRANAVAEGQRRVQQQQANAAVEEQRQQQPANPVVEEPAPQPANPVEEQAPQEVVEAVAVVEEPAPQPPVNVEVDEQPGPQPANVVDGQSPPQQDAVVEGNVRQTRVKPVAVAVRKQRVKPVVAKQPANADGTNRQIRANVVGAPTRQAPTNDGNHARPQQPIVVTKALTRQQQKAVAIPRLPTGSPEESDDDDSDDGLGTPRVNLQIAEVSSSFPLANQSNVSQSNAGSSGAECKTRSKQRFSLSYSPVEQTRKRTRQSEEGSGEGTTLAKRMRTICPLVKAVVTKPGVSKERVVTGRARAVHPSKAQRGGGLPGAEVNISGEQGETPGAPSRITRSSGPSQVIPAQILPEAVAVAGPPSNEKEAKQKQSKTVGSPRDVDLSASQVTPSTSAADEGAGGKPEEAVRPSTRRKRNSAVAEPSLQIGTGARKTSNSIIPKRSAGKNVIQRKAQRQIATQLNVGKGGRGRNAKSQEGNMKERRVRAVSVARTRVTRSMKK